MLSCKVEYIAFLNVRALTTWLTWKTVKTETAPNSSKPRVSTSSVNMGAVHHEDHPCDDLKSTSRSLPYIMHRNWGLESVFRAPCCLARQRDEQLQVRS